VTVDTVAFIQVINGQAKEIQEAGDTAKNGRMKMNSDKLITLFLLAVLMLFALYIWMQSPTPQTHSRIVVPMGWIKQRHAVHGIESSVYNDQGECYFLRNGKKCNL
jgi:hypothetical protein